MSRPLRVIFAGTPDFAAINLTALLGSRHRVVAVYTQPDRPAGRGRKLMPGPVKRLAMQHDIPVYQPLSLRDDDAQQTLAALDADLMVVVAYGLILPRAILETPRLGCINVHASLLPRWRGAAPLQRAIEAGDSESGVTIMQMDEGLDTGDMLRVERTPITDTTTGGELHDRLALLGGEALLETLEAVADGSVIATPQPEQGVTYAAKLSKAEAELDFRQDASQLAARIRAFNPWPVAWCVLGDDRLRLLMASVGRLEDGESPSAPGTLLAHHESALRITCGEAGDQVLSVSQAQLPGGKAMSVHDLLLARAERLAPGIRLGQLESAS
ncbi:MAG: methionyl-tRNA formyltransferase [Halomonas sp.]|uniref:methionyl-tRNA formyltransferase n=1 Tax=Halomonas sp. TaxID=1486246 RepID=UPI003F9073DA